jgi:hypothetical protein
MQILSPPAFQIPSMLMEFKWMARTCLLISTYFSEWIDVQELITQHCINHGWNRRCPLSQDTAIDAMCIPAPRYRGYLCRQRSRRRALLLIYIVWSSAKHPPLNYEDLEHRYGLKLYTYLPSDVNLPRGDYPHTGRISARDDGALPLNSASAVYRAFKKYNGLKAFGCNSRAEHAARDGIKDWWVSFYGKEDLEAFVAAVDGSSIKWTQLHVLGTAHEPTTPTPKVRSPDDF